MTDFLIPQSILMWTNQNPKYPNSFIIKIANRKLLGLTRTDKNGTTYWKFKEREPKVEKGTETSPVRDNIQKFQARQAKTEQLNNSHEQSTNSVASNNSSE